MLKQPLLSTRLTYNKHLPTAIQHICPTYKDYDTRYSRKLVDMAQSFRGKLILRYIVKGSKRVWHGCTIMQMDIPQVRV